MFCFYFCFLIFKVVFAQIDEVTDNFTDGEFVDIQGFVARMLLQCCINVVPGFEFNVPEENISTSSPTTEVHTALSDEDVGILTSTISLHKEIIIVSEENESWPIFQNLPYVFTVNENASVGNDLYHDILVTSSNSDDASKIVLKCDKETTPEACKKFSIKTEDGNEGEFRGVIQLQEGLDFDTTSTYILPIKAEYVDTSERHVASAIVVIEVTDEQDLGPQFGSETYHVHIQEESAEEKVVLSLDVFDADRGNPRALLITLENDVREFFKINRIQNDTSGNYFVEISTSGKPIDREEREILWNGGFYVFQIRATELENSKPNDVSASADIWVNVLDVNDNPPVFDRSNVTINLAENYTVDLPLPAFYLHVTDLDVAENGKFNLSLVSERLEFENLFEIEPMSAEGSVPVTLKISKDAKLDYEDPLQREMNFMITASDNSKHSRWVNVTILLQDANDNSPVFEQSEYSAHVTIRNASNSLVAVVNASDRDSGQFGRVEYEIIGEKLQQFYISPENGSVYMGQCSDVCAPQTYHLVLKASDVGGKFALATLTVITELPTPNVTSPTKVMAEINFTNSIHNTTIREITKEGTVVARLQATSSDPEARVLYSLLSGAEDNFVIDPTEGILRVAPGAVLDIDRTKLKDYNISIGAGHASSNEVSDVARIYITIEDVNNKPPKFDNRFYVVHLDRAKSVGDEIFEASALDPDQGADLKYSFGKTIILHSKDGNVSADPLGISDVLQINGSTGVVVVLRSLSDYFMALFRVTVEDMAAQTPGQSDSAEIIILITGSENELAWELPLSVIALNVSEEMEIGSQILVLGGPTVPKRGDLIFEKLRNSDPDDYFDVNSISGALTTKKSIDYEKLPEQNKKLDVEITVLLSGREVGNVSVTLNILDVNDNRPKFLQSNYLVSVMESIEEQIECLRLIARDDDDGEFGEIVYRLSGDSKLFEVNEKGTLYKKSGVSLDREIEPFHSVRVLAIDNPKDAKNQKTGQTTVQITVGDANDNSPKFSRNLYTVIVPENLPLHSPFFKIQAHDADVGNNSLIKYSITNPMQISELFGIDEDAGILYTNRSLSSTGRSFPYQLRVKATDSGNPPASSTCEVEVHVGDLSVQDELPRFIFPSKGEIIYVVESDREDITICQVELSKPVRFKNMKSVVRFSLLDLGYGGSNGRFFTINTDTGLITTRRPLDREARENYTLVVAATQVGPYMPQAYHVIYVSVTDVNDNVPYFPRPVNSDPLEMTVLEESDPGTSVGIIEAVDRDKGENAAMLYSILGDEKSAQLFGINNTDDGKAVIYVKDRLDHEKKTFYDLVIGVGNPSPSNAKSINRQRDGLYDPQDLSKLRVRVNLIDIDDNDIQFVSPTENLGVRLNAPRQSIVTTIQAYDPDASDNPLQYFIEKVAFQKDGQDEITVYEEMFFLEKDSGVLRTAQSLSNFEDGTFHLAISGRSARKSTLFRETKFEIKVLHDSHMLKFVFQKPPTEVQRELRNMNRDFQTVAELPQPVTLQLADTQLNIKQESFINADSTNVCFQMIKDKLPIHLTEAQTMLDSSGKPSLERFYKNYNISHIGPCDQVQLNYRMNWIEILILVIACLVAIAVVISIVVIGCVAKH